MSRNVFFLSKLTQGHDTRHEFHLEVYHSNYHKRLTRQRNIVRNEVSCKFQLKFEHST